MKIREIVKREFHIMFVQNRSAAGFFIGIPLIYLLLFGVLYTANTVNYIPAVVCDQDQTFLSRQLVQAFADSERFQIISRVGTQEELERLMTEKEAQVGISIPVNFARDVKKGATAPVLLEVNGSNIIFANTAISAAQDLVGKFYPQISKQLIETAGVLPGRAAYCANPVEVGIRVLNNPTFGYTNFLLIGLGLYALQIGMMLTVGPLVNREFQHADQWRETSVPAILLGKIVVYWLCGFLTFVAYVMICVHLFTLPFRGVVIQAALLGAAYVFAVAALACLIGVIAPNEEFAALFPLLYIMPSLLFSGYIWPLMSMNTFSYVFSRLVPIGYVADNMRDLMLNGHAPALLHDTVILGVAGIVLLVISSGLFGWRRRKNDISRGEIML